MVGLMSVLPNPKPDPNRPPSPFTRDAQRERKGTPTRSRNLPNRRQRSHLDADMSLLGCEFADLEFDVVAFDGLYIEAERRDRFDDFV